MKPRTFLATLTVIGLMAVAAALGACRGETQPGTGAPALADVPRLDPAKCFAMWTNGFELQGLVGARASRAYLDMASLTGRDDQVSGIVVPADADRQGPLADAVAGLAGQAGDADCDVRLQGEEGIDDSVWQLRIDSSVRVTGTHRTSNGRTEPVAFSVVPETPCDGAGEWRTFSAPDWPVTFDYPANWALTADADDVNLECPSPKALASGGSFLTFERGQVPMAEPYWFFRRAGDDWRVKGAGCDPEANPARDDGCYPARRSDASGMTVLQGAAGEHRRYRPGKGYIGQGAGIMRYLWIVGDRWISLDSTEWTHDDVGTRGGPVLIDGDDVGERVVRSVRPR